MFSPDATIHSTHSTSTRNPRRRQRNDSDSIRQQPLRKRSKLSEDTFISPAQVKTNGNGNIGMDGHVNDATKTHAASMHMYEMPVREKKHSAVGKRNSKGDGSIILSKTAAHTVKQLPSLPERLRSKPTEDFRASILPSSPFALALTRNEALIWDYTSPVASPTARTLPLPHPLKPSEPLPLGSIVMTGPSSELGLVVVTSSTGKITFWDNVDSAASLSLFQQRKQSVEGSVGSMLSGETITKLVDAEHAGFVLSFSSGRLAQLTIRDPQGRPYINVQFLRNGGSSASGGLFGPLRSVFSGGGWRRDTAAVKARPSATKGHMEVITTTTSGLFQFWDISWAGQQAFKGETDAREAIENVVQGYGDAHGSEDTTVVDFAILPKSSVEGNELSIVGTDEGVGLLILVAINGASSLRHALVEVTIAAGAAVLQRIIPLDPYGPPSVSHSTIKAELLVPQPGHTAFVLFEDSVVVASLASQQDSPEAQLLSGTGKSRIPFMDVIYFRRDRALPFVGHGLEAANAKSRASSCTLFTKRAGAIRFIANAPKHDGRAAERMQATAKSKIEQAVFYGTKPENILDLQRKPEVPFDEDDVAEAALQISHEILTSTSEHMPIITTSMEHQLSSRAQALKDLAVQVRKYYPHLSRVAKWQLMWDAEKMAAARGIWTYYDARLKLKDARHRSLLAELVEMLHERYKTSPRPEFGELDPVRVWFVNDVARMDYIIPWAFNSIKELHSEGVKDHVTMMQLVSEADDILLGALESAFEFRNENAPLYGLGDEPIEEGILQTGYEGLSAFWTSTYNIVNATKHLTDFSRSFTTVYFNVAADEQDPNPSVVRKVIDDNPRLVKLCCQTHIERYRWCLAQPDEKFRAAGQSLKHEFETRIRHKAITELGQIGLGHEGMRLAEKLNDMTSLAELAHDEWNYHLNEAALDPAQRVDRTQRLKQIRSDVDRYFRTFGDRWASAFYSVFIERHELGTLFETPLRDQYHFTNFLRADPSRAKLCWINDAAEEEEFGNAASSLMHAATVQESNSWCKKVELSLARLAILAEEGKRDSTTAAATTNGEETKTLSKTISLNKLKSKDSNELKLLGIQEKLYKHIRPTVVGALDHDSALETVMETWGKHAVSGRRALQQLLKRGFEELMAHRVMSAELLIDVLTLMDQTPSESSPDDICGQEFWMAFQALQYSGLEANKQEHETTLKLIWKRCFIRDDWAAVNNTTDKPDDELQAELETTALFATLKQGVSAASWDTSPSLHRLPPSDVLGAACRPSELRDRFPSDDIREAMCHDNEMDDLLLQDYIDKCQLGYWYGACKEAAVKAALREAEARAEKLRRERELKGMIVEPVFDEGAADGGDGRNGEAEGEGVDGFDGEEEEEERSGDVEMEDA